MNKEGRITSFTDLIVWQKGHLLVLKIFMIIKDFPREAYFLADQMRRSVSSTTSNIAEGFGRQTYKEKVQFYYQAKGSLTELKDQLLIARDLKYIKDDRNVYDLCNETDRLLQGLINASKRKR